MNVIDLPGKDKREHNLGIGSVLLLLAVLVCSSHSALAKEEEPAGDKVEQSGVEATQAEKESDKTTPEEKESAVEKSAAEDRERGAHEDPMHASRVRRILKRIDKKKTAPNEFELYGSLRIRYRDTGGEAEFQDGGSRIGAAGHLRVRKNYFLFARYEAGFNMLAREETGSGNGEHKGGGIKDSLFRRLAYVGLDSQHGYIAVGKNWSTYYDVSHITDRFTGTGASASGTFNAQTDGGPTGTGRANKALQSKLSLKILPEKRFKPLGLNFQVQHGNAIPFGNGADYGTAFGVSALATTRKNFSIGAAYNHADIDLGKYPSLRNIGITGSARALLLGARTFGHRWYAGLVVSRLENHSTTDEGVYFDGWGSELYGQFRVFDRWWIAGGYNWLKPDSNQSQAGRYRVKYSVLELRYSFTAFRQMFFANVRFNDGVKADGTPGDNVYTIGVKWDMAKHGWQRFD
jgi:hypothetical protein